VTATWVGGSAAVNAGFAVSLTIPAGAAAGDVAVVAHAYNQPGGDSTITAGWTQLDSRDFSASFRGRLYYRVLGAGEAGGTVTLTNAVSQKLAASIGVLSGVSAVDVHNFTIESTVTTTHAAPTVTAGTGDAGLAFILERESTPSTAFTHSTYTVPPGGTAHNVGSGATSAGVAYSTSTVPAAGTVGGGNWVGDVANDGVIMWIVGVTVAAVPLSLTASGAATSTGNAALREKLALASSGTATSSGTAAILGKLPLAAAGTATSSGAAALSVTTPAVPVATVELDRSPFKIQIFTNTYPYQKVGEVGSYSSCEFTLRHNAIGSWKINLSPSDRSVLELARADRRITVDYRGTRVMSGEVHGIRRARDDRKITNEIYGFDDKRWLNRRLGYPNPLAAFPADGTSFTQSVLADTFTDNAETIIKNWVARNAVTRHPIAGLVVAPDLGRGPVDTDGPRWEPLDEVCFRVAQANGIGISLEQVDDHLVFDVYVPATQPVRLSENLGNLRSWEYVLEAPIATRLVVGMAGEELARKYMQKKLPASETYWLATEKFEDISDATVDAVASTKASLLLTGYAAQAGFSITPVDTEAMAYARDYNLGDKVKVEVAQDTFLPDIVAQVVLSHSAGSAPKITPTVGNADSSNKSTAFARRYLGLVARILRQERSR
jgi:hypothetical protein